MGEPSKFPRDPFHTHRMEVNFHLSKPEDIQKFIPKKGENRLGTLANWFKAEKNRIAHYAKHRVWVGHKAVKEQLKEYKEFANLKLQNKDSELDEEYLKTTAGRITALASLFTGTKIEKEADELLKTANEIAAQQPPEALKGLKDTVSQLSAGFDGEELKPANAAQGKVEQDLLQEIRTNKKFAKSIIRLKKSYDKNSPEAKTLSFLLQKAQLQSKLIGLKLDPALADHDFKSVKLLFSSRLIYNIVGFQNTTPRGLADHEIKLSPEGQIMIKKEGQWVKFSKIMEDLECDKDTPLRGLVEKRKPGEPENELRQRWNYYSPNGLIPVFRYPETAMLEGKRLSDEELSAILDMRPVEQLSAAEMADLLAHAQTFNPTGEVDPAKTCVLQIYTNPEALTKHGDNFFLSRLSASLPVHAGIRMVFSDGTVYSTGLSGLPEEQPLKEGTKNMLVTVNSAPAMLDYKEFYPHEGRIVTSIPISPEVFKWNMEKINEYRKKTVRFNLAKQNCVYLAEDLLQPAGIDPVAGLSVGGLFTGILPSVTNIAVIGKPLKKIDRKVGKVKDKVVGIMPKPVKVTHKFAHKVVWFIPSLIAKVGIINLGGGRGSPKKHDEGNEGLSNEAEMANFSHILPTEEIFDNKSLQLKYSLPLIQWQLKQKSTSVHPYEGTPRMGIIPPSDEKVIEAGEKRRKVFVKRFLTNFNLE